MSPGKCLAQGSAAPGPVPKGTIRIYSMRFCPYAHRTWLVLHAKGIKHEVVNIHLRDKPDWFLKKNPVGLVPTLETSAGEVIHDSPIVCEYLDEAYPDKKLFPPTPFERAVQKMLLERFSKTSGHWYKIPTGKLKGEDVSGMEAELKETLTKLEVVLAAKKTKFFGGDSITMIDYLMWPWFERLEGLGLKEFFNNTPELNKWTQRMLEDPAVKAYFFSADIHKAFFKTFATGKPDYDLGL